MLETAIEKAKNPGCEGLSLRAEEMGARRDGVRARKGRLRRMKRGEKRSIFRWRMHRKSMWRDFFSTGRRCDFKGKAAAALFFLSCILLVTLSASLNQPTLHVPPSGVSVV